MERAPAHAAPKSLSLVQRSNTQRTFLTSKHGIEDRFSWQPLRASDHLFKIGLNDLPTAEYVSNRHCEATTVITSGGSGTGTSRSSSANGQDSTGSSTNHNDNWQQHGRKLLKPEEVMALPERTAITFTPGVPPVCTTLVRYYEEPGLGRRPGWWEGCKAAAKVAFGSLLLLVGAAFLAACVTAGSGGGQQPQPPAKQGQVQWDLPKHNR